MTRRLILAFLTGLWLVAACAPARAAERGITVFAAASLKGALDAVAEGWTAASGQPVRASYAGSSLVARQVAAGAPADLVVLASAPWMDWLVAQGAVQPATRRDILGNALVLMAPRDRAAPLALNAADLQARLEGGRMAIALTEAVPAGQYGRQALTALGLWPAVQDRLAETDNTRAALALVARGEVPLGLGYLSDAMAEPRVAVVARIPAAGHDPIRYPAALTGQGDAGAAFLAYLSSPEAQAVFAGHGFSAPAGSG